MFICGYTYYIFYVNNKLTTTNINIITNMTNISPIPINDITIGIFSFNIGEFNKPHNKAYHNLKTLTEDFTKIFNTYCY